MLGWEEDLYWKVQGKLVEQGDIAPGPGYGGTVRLTVHNVEPTDQETSTNPSPIIAAKERDLYPQLRQAIERWIKRFGFDAARVEETHSRGSKNTGGTFTRPDITVAGIRRYVYLPKRLEIVSFEIKPTHAVGIMGILEAIAHREAAHRSYVLYATSRANFATASENDRILELAQKYGVGVVLTEKPQEVESWEILIDAIRHEPDPSRLERFLHDLPNEDMKNVLAKWKE